MNWRNRRQPQQELHELLSVLLDDAINDDQRNRLRELLRKSAALRHEYSRWMDLHGDLLNHWSLIEAALPPTEKRRPSRKRVVRSRPFVVAALLLLCVALGLHWWASHGPVVARLMSQSGGHLLQGVSGVSWRVRGSLRTGRYRLPNGLAQLRFEGGVVASVQGPSSFELVSANALRLYEGKLTVRAPPEVKGFKVLTNKGQFVDQGTEFAVDASSSRDEVHVFSGRVDLYPDAHPALDMSGPLMLKTGEGAVLDEATRTPAAIDAQRDAFIDAEPFAATLPEYAQLIAANKPLLWLRMEPVDGTPRLIDFTGSSSDGTLLGKTELPEWGRGACGSALQFGGPASLQFGIVPNYRKPPAGRITGMVLVNAHSRPRWASIAKNWAGGQVCGQFHLGLNSDDGDVEIQMQDAAGRQIRARERVPLPMHRWQHLAFTHDGQAIRLYRNGREVAIEPCSGQTVGNLPAIGIGAKLNADGTRMENQSYGIWHGRLDEFVLFDRVLTASEIATLSASALKDVTVDPSVGNTE